MDHACQSSEDHKTEKSAFNEIALRRVVYKSEFPSWSLS